MRGSLTQTNRRPPKTKKVVVVLEEEEGMTKRDRKKCVGAINTVRNFPCILCGGTPQFAGFFVPTRKAAKLLGEPPGKERLIAYALCEQCMELENVYQLVEDVLLGGRFR